MRVAKLKAANGWFLGIALAFALSLAALPAAGVISQVQVAVADVSGVPGAPLAVDVSVAAGSGLQSLSAVLSYDATLLGYTGITVLVPDCIADANPIGSGSLSIAVACMAPRTDGGALVEIDFATDGPCGASSALTLASCGIDEGAAQCVVENGSAALRCGAGGNIVYYRGDRPVPAAEVELDDGITAPQSTMTNASGVFGFDEVGSDWSATPVKMGGQGGAISALDAAYVLQEQVGMRQFDAMQMFACDVTGNGSVSSLDAARILQFAVGILPRFEVADMCGSDWAFWPVDTGSSAGQMTDPSIGAVCQAGAISYDGLAESPVAPQFYAIVFGDCTGNWQPPAPALQATAPQRRALVRLGRARRALHGRLRVPVRVRRAFNALQLDLAYDPRAESPLTVTNGKRAAGAAVSWRAEDGRLTIALASADALRPGTVLWIELAADRSRASSLRIVGASVDEH
jgi:Dockerin type I domain